MNMFKSIDEQLKDLGFYKLASDDEKEDYYGVCYRKDRGIYVQRLDIRHKANGRHIIQSYQEGINSDGFNNVVGLTYKETKLAMKKYKQLKRKYKWS